MFRALGTVILLYVFAQYFSSTFVAADRTAVAVLETVEIAAHVSTAQLKNIE